MKRWMTGLRTGRETHAHLWGLGVLWYSGPVNREIEVRLGHSAYILSLSGGKGFLHGAWPKQSKTKGL